MTVFLTPDGEPFFGGTYFPPEPTPRAAELPAGARRRCSDALPGAARRRREPGGRARRAPSRRSSASAPSADPLTESAARRRRRGASRVRVRRASGAASAARPSSRQPLALEFLLRMHLRGDDGRAADGDRRRSTRMAARRHVRPRSAAASTATRSTRRGSCRTSRRCSTTTRCSPRRTSTPGSSPASERYRRVTEETLDYVLRELRLPEGGFASAQDADTDGVEGLTFTWTAEEGVREELLQPFEHGRSVIRGELERGGARAALRDPRAAPEAGPRRQGDRGLERARARSARRGGARLERDDYLDAAARARRVPARPALDSDGRLHRTFRAGEAKGTGYLEDYADVAHGLLELHVATGDLRWLEEANRLARLAVELFARRGARRLLSLAGRRRAARRAQEGPRGPPDAVGQLDARLRPAPARADLRRRRARAARGRRLPARPRRVPRAPSAFGHALSALDLHFSPPRELAIVGPVDSPVARAALERFQPERGRRRRPGRGRPAPRGQGPRRRQAGRLRLRALRLPGARSSVEPKLFTASLQSPHAFSGDSPPWQPRIAGSPGSPRRRDRRGGRAQRRRLGGKRRPRPARTSS